MFRIASRSPFGLLRSWMSRSPVKSAPRRPRALLTVDSLEDRMLLSASITLRLVEDLPANSVATKVSGKELTQSSNEVSLASYNFHIENPIKIGSSSGGAGAGKAKLSDVSFVIQDFKVLPSLIKNLSSGTHYDYAEIISWRDGKPAVRWELGFLILNKVEVTGPVDPQISVVAMVGDVRLTAFSKGLPVFNQWNFTANQSDELAYLPAPAEGILSTDFGGAPAPKGGDVLDLTTGTALVDSFSFAMEQDETLGSATGGAGGGKATFQPLTIETPFNNTTPEFLSRTVKGQHFDKLTLTQRLSEDGVTTFEFATAVLSSFQMKDAFEDEPTVTVSFEYGAVNTKFTKLPETKDAKAKQEFASQHGDVFSPALIDALFNDDETLPEPVKQDPLPPPPLPTLVKSVSILDMIDPITVTKLTTQLSAKNLTTIVNLVDKIDVTSLKMPSDVKVSLVEKSLKKLESDLAKTQKPKERAEVIKKVVDKLKDATHDKSKPGKTKGKHVSIIAAAVRRALEKLKFGQKFQGAASQGPKISARG